MNVFRRALAAALVAALFLTGLPAPSVHAADGDYKLLALTFDDGPSKYTEELLDGLRARGVYCTFFMVGYMAARYPALLQRMADDGHQLANHTYDHAILNPSNVSWEVEGCRQYLSAVTEEDTYYVRPPYGTLYKGVAEQLNAPAILWSVDPYDWKTSSAAAVVYNVVNTAKDGDIILLHDSHAHSVQAALQIIDILQARGFEFVTVRELFRRRGITPENGTKYFSARNTGVNLPPAAPEYYDEKKLDQHWAWEAIQYVVQRGYFTGTDTGKFLPNYRITRAMFLTVLGRAAGAAVSPAGPMPYADVDPESYAAPYIRWAAERGILPAAAEGAELHPDADIPRAEIARLLYRLYALTGRDQTVPADFVLTYQDAADIPADALEGVRWCTYAGIFRGDGTNFSPLGAATRAQAAALLMQLDRLPGFGADEPFPPEEPQQEEDPKSEEEPAEEEAPAEEAESHPEEPEAAETVRCVVIDPGHQSHADTDREPVAPGSGEMKYRVTGGTRGVATGLPEYELNLQVSLALREELERRGYRVILTREENDVSLSNIERTQIANDAGADVFLRIHANGSENSADTGALAIIMPPDSPYNSSLYANSRALAEAVLDHMTEQTGAYRRSIWETTTMTGINWSAVPVTILEMGFMTNPEEDRLMASAEYQEKIVTGIADGIDAYFAALEGASGETPAAEEPYT